jgi:2-cysteine adaptor domain
MNIQTCGEFFSNPDVNPISKRKIKKDGPTYTRLLKECEALRRAAARPVKPAKKVTSPAASRPAKKAPTPRLSPPPVVPKQAKRATLPARVLAKKVRSPRRSPAPAPKSVQRAISPAKRSPARVLAKKVRSPRRSLAPAPKSVQRAISPAKRSPARVLAKKVRSPRRSPAPAPKSVQRAISPANRARTINRSVLNESCVLNPLPLSIIPLSKPLVNNKIPSPTSPTEYSPSMTSETESPNEEYPYKDRILGSPESRGPIQTLAAKIVPAYAFQSTISTPNRNIVGSDSKAMVNLFLNVCAEEKIDPDTILQIGTKTLPLNNTLVNNFMSYYSHHNPLIGIASDDNSMFGIRIEWFVKLLSLLKGIRIAGFMLPRTFNLDYLKIPFPTEQNSISKVRFIYQSTEASILLVVLFL